MKLSTQMKESCDAWPKYLFYFCSVLFGNWKSVFFTLKNKKDNKYLL